MRQRSQRGPAYDELLGKGIPHRMLRRAWVVADGDPEEAMGFIRANFDQPGAFWLADGESDDAAAEGARRFAPQYHYNTIFMLLG